MKMVLGVEGGTKENPYYTTLKSAFPNLVATNTPQGIIDWVYRSFYEDVILIMDEDFLVRTIDANYLFYETIRGLARNNGNGFYVIVFAKPGAHSLPYVHLGIDLIVRAPIKPSRLPQRIRGFLRRNRVK